MRTLAASADLPSRIRFMLQDTIELRLSNWNRDRYATLELTCDFLNLKLELLLPTFISNFVVLK